MNNLARLTPEQHLDAYLSGLRAHAKAILDVLSKP